MKKTTFFNWNILLLALFMNVMPMSSQEIDDKTIYFVIEEDVIDTDLLEKMKTEKAKKFEKEKNEKVFSLNSEIDFLKQLIAIGEKKDKIEEDHLYNYAVEFFDEFQKIAPDLLDVYNYKKEGWNSGKVQAVGKIKDINKVINMFIKKRKVSNQMVPYLSILAYEKEKELINIKSSKPDLSIEPQDIPYKKIQRKVRNPNNRAYCYDKDYFRLDSIDKMIHMAGWEWIQREKSEDVYTMAPFSMTYKRYNSHPQYRIFDDKVFDNEGNLVCLLYLQRNNENIMRLLREELKKEIYIEDYKANKYDILKSREKIQENVKLMLGLPYKPFVDAKTAKKNKKVITDYFDKRANAERATGDYHQRARARREADEASMKMGVLMWNNLNDKDYNSAYEFVQMLEKLHEYDLSMIWKITRVSPTSFKVSFMKGNKSTYTGLVTINQTKPYSWQYTFKMVPNEENIEPNSSIWSY